MKTKTAISILLLVFVGFGVVVGRCFYLQYYHNDDYRTMSARSQRSSLVERPRRGAILDCKGRILAASLSLDTIFAEPRAIEDVAGTATKIADVLGVDANEIAAKISGSRNPGYVKLVDGACLTDLQRGSLRKIYGIGIERNWRRYYPLGSVCSHVVGFVGADGVGLAGVEQKYDSLLGGVEGESTFFADARRRPISVKHFGSFAVDGPDLVLTIDATIQAFAHSALSKQVAEFEAESGFAIVMDPCSGGLLAMVSLPDFDPSNLSSLDANSLRNNALTEPFEPGSIFKPIVAACAIDSGSIGPDDVIYCEKGHYAGKGFGRIGEYKHGFEDLSIKEILAVSSNIGMAKIGQAMGAEKIYNGIKLFGFGSQTGVDLPGEEPGLVWPVEKWTGYSVARVPYGHELMVTGIQIAAGYCVLASGGRMSRPYVANALLNNADRKIKHINPVTTGGYIIKPDTADWMVNVGLTEVVKTGTARKVAIEGYHVWGKTGTANIAKSNEKGYDNQNYVASFAGGAGKDKPELVILVSIRQPNRKLGKGYTGGRVAGPAAREILEKSLRYIRKDSD